MVEYTPTLDLTYSALAHGTRRQLLEILRSGPARVTALADPFDISLAATSKHLRALEQAGLVTRAIHGRDHLITLQPESLRSARDWIDTYRSFWESRLDALDSQLRRRKRS